MVRFKHAITSFREGFRFLGNAAMASVRSDGLVCQPAERARQVQKMESPGLQGRIAPVFG